LQELKTHRATEENDRKERKINSVRERERKTGKKKRRKNSVREITTKKER